MVCTYAKVMISVALVACHRTPSARERALSLLPAEPAIVAAADGPAIAQYRRAMEVVRPYVPATFGCVIDAVPRADAVALAHGEAGTTVVVITRVAVEGCPALARIAADTYVATLGDSTIAHGLGDHWSRARSYLASAPIAFAAELGDRHVLAAAETGAAWLAIDAADPSAVKLAIDAEVARWRSLASKLSVTRTGSQVLVRGKGVDPDELATIASDVLRDLDRPARVTPPVFTCPATGGLLVHCTATTLTVRSMPDAIALLATAAPDRVVAGGAVTGLRVTAPVFSLIRGDVILGIDAHKLSTADDLDALAHVLPKRVSVAVRRGDTDEIIELAEE